jgi:hypothetical protein
MDLLAKANVTYAKWRNRQLWDRVWISPWSIEYGKRKRKRKKQMTRKQILAAPTMNEFSIKGFMTNCYFSKYDRGTCSKGNLLSGD